MASIKEKLSNIQSKAKAPKDLENTFGGFKYRNAEKIEEMLKPLCKEERTTLIITDELAGGPDGWHYIQSYAKLMDWDSDEYIVSSASAREQEVKKGMDASQISGSASSYARKYALCGLFLLDDGKDADSMDNSDEGEIRLTQFQYDKIYQNRKLIADKLKALNIKGTEDLKLLTRDQATELCNAIEKALQNGN